jgi:hypothetical protein
MNTSEAPFTGILDNRAMQDRVSEQFKLLHFYRNPKIEGRRKDLAEHTGVSDARHVSRADVFCNVDRGRKLGGPESMRTIRENYLRWKDSRPCKRGFRDSHGRARQRMSTGRGVLGETGRVERREA